MYITIKIDSETLAREVLETLGYDEPPELLDDDDDEDEIEPSGES